MEDDYIPFDLPGEYNSNDSNDKEIDRLNDVEWATLQALRDMLGISLKGSSRPTYLQALALGKALAPEIFDSEHSVLGNDQERLLVREYRQLAKAKSNSEHRDVEPIELVDEDIKRYSDLLNMGKDHLLRRKIGVLRNVRKDLAPKEYTENQLILRDTFKVKRDFPGQIHEGDTYRDFELARGRGLRLRLLHPDPVEHSLGADLLYEQYWDAKKLARVVLVQYKIWNGKVLYLSQSPNLKAQLDKLDEIFCQKDMCCAFPGSKRSDSYRLPYCSVFLKPTDKLQDKNSTLVSNGLYVPVCVVRTQLEDTTQGNKKLERKRIRSEALSHKFFEEAFNVNMLGSKWLTYEELEKFYKEYRYLIKMIEFDYTLVSGK